jgi:hypothetical protein
MSDNIVKWLSNYEKWLSHVGAQARGVDRFDRGVSAWLGGGCQHARPLSHVGLVGGADRLGWGHVGLARVGGLTHFWLVDRSR